MNLRYFYLPRTSHKRNFIKMGVKICHIEERFRQEVKKLLPRGIQESTPDGIKNVSRCPEVFCFAIISAILAYRLFGGYEAAIWAFSGVYLVVDINFRNHVRMHTMEGCSFVELESMEKIEKKYYSRGGCFLVAVDDDTEEVVGSVGIYETKTMGPNLPEKTLELVRMSVIPAHRRKGIGIMLVKECKKYARVNKFKQLVVESSENLYPAQRFYEKNGFKLYATYTITPGGISWIFGYFHDASVFLRRVMDCFNINYCCYILDVTYILKLNALRIKRFKLIKSYFLSMINIYILNFVSNNKMPF